ncbi:hypothetical protein GS489_05610, partial [Rhodococcus hoagii]|nr:hypothetical protein [Prescottella equi]
MLSPDSRLLLTDALQPPDGYVVDSVVTTTYSLDLTALLLAPLSFAARAGNGELDTVEPIALLESVRRYTDALTVFGQAGALRAPGKYRTVLSFAENAVVEVQAPPPPSAVPSQDLAAAVCLRGGRQLPAPVPVLEPQSHLRRVLGHPSGPRRGPRRRRRRRPHPDRRVRGRVAGSGHVADGRG